MQKAVKNMTYVEFMAFLSETNRPPGGKRALKKLLDYCDVTKESSVLDVGCNTGFCTFETARLKKCSVVGIDLSPNMIMEAKAMAQRDAAIKNLVSFLIVDAKKMPFEDNEFDLVFSGGSTAFVDDIPAALSEYKRVAKEWGFIADINFYYKQSPRPGLIDELNAMMGTNIEEWNLNRWEQLYQEAGLEIFEIFEDDISHVSDAAVDKYIDELLADKNSETKVEAKERLRGIMRLFNENHKYLGYAIFILRKRPIREEPYLFAP